MSATVRAELSEKLSRILKEDTVIRSSHLLRAYATFATLGELSDGELIKAYSELVNSGAYPKGAVLYISQRAKIEDVEDTASAFRCYSVEEFLRFIVLRKSSSTASIAVSISIPSAATNCISSRSAIKRKSWSSLSRS